MNGTNAKTACQTGCWLMAGAIGLVVLVMMSVLSGMSIGAALLGTAIVTAVLGLLLTWILCRPVDGADDAGATQTAATQTAAAVQQAPARATPAPTSATALEPTPATAPAPAPAAAPTPAAPMMAVAPAMAAAPAATAETTPAAMPKATAAPTTPKQAPAAKPVAGSAAPVAAPAQFAALDDAAVIAAGSGRKPAGLAAPRGGKPDDLKLIEGVGPVLEQRLHDWGIWHFDQIASWGPAEVAFADQNVPRFKGRASRDKWVAQARIIVTEGVPAFLERAKTNDY